LAKFNLYIQKRKTRKFTSKVVLVDGGGCFSVGVADVRTGR
jgi:hypothetical protein